MKTLVACLLAAGMVVTAAAPADARQGCGPGGHRGPRGICRPNGGDRWVVGRYYRGRGWYDGRRWYQNRYRDHGDWRYR